MRTSKRHYNSTYTFSTSLSNLAASVSDGVTLVVNEATSSGWAATTTHAAMTVKQCGIYHGSADPAGGNPATVESVVMCTF